MVMGTVGYMSPEQVRGRTADHRSDIFGFGTILYEMVRGKQTFRKPTSAETMTAVLNEDPPSISQVTAATPPGLRRVVHRCLEKSPEQRFQSASDMAFALEALSDTGMAPSTGSHAHLAEPASRRGIAIAGAILAVLLGAGALTYFWIRAVVLSESGFRPTMTPTLRMMRVLDFAWRLPNCQMSSFLTSDCPITTAILFWKVFASFPGLLA
jgi:hypothetical protein